MKTKKVSIFTGPQFRDGKAVFPFFVAAILILAAVISFLQGAISTSLILIPIIFFVINFILDFQGVEIDYEKGVVRVYKLDLLFKYGKWESFTDFYAIGLDYETYVIKEVTLYTSMTTEGGSRFTNVREGSFFISIINKDPQKNIVLAERNDYLEGKSTAIKLSEKTDLPFHNFYMDRVEEAKKKRTRL